MQLAWKLDPEIERQARVWMADGSDTPAGAIRQPTAQDQERLTRPPFRGRLECPWRASVEFVFILSVGFQRADWVLPSRGLEG